MSPDSDLELVKARAFELYLNQYPNVNLSVIANEVGRHRSRLARWAKAGDWRTTAERLHEKAMEKKRADVTTAMSENDEPGKPIDLTSAKTFDEVLDMMAETAETFISDGSFRFTSANELIRFMEMAEKRAEQRRKTEQDAEGGSDLLSDSSLPNQEADALRAGMLLINAAKTTRLPDNE